MSLQRQRVNPAPSDLPKTARSFSRSFHQALLDPTRPCWPELPPNLTSPDPTGPERTEDGQLSPKQRRIRRRQGLLGSGHRRHSCWLLIPGRRPTAQRVSPEPLAPHVSTRDEPVNLSGSRPEAHQHRSPAGASCCCQSLLLDPNAMIRIDLHKRLFLLVTGRGE
jgi:hypothetical protein